MADFSCDIKSPCLDPSTPFINTTAEAPDKPIFLARNTGYGPSYPPLGQNWTQLGCTAVCESTVSQADADQCAARNWMLCIGDKWPPLPPLPAITDRFGRPVPNPSPRPIYLSASQSVTITCPDGLPFIYTLPAGTFTGFSQAMADAEALSYAQQQAPTFAICIGGLTPNVCCAGVTYSGSVTASGGQLTAANACWEIFGSLPPGITSDLDSSLGCIIGDLTLNFGGTPTTAGVYNFAVKVTDAIGNYMLKPVTLTVSGITTTGFPDGAPGTNYNPTLAVNITSAGVTNPIYSLESGALPDGLLLDSGGIIYGTPTTAGTFNFQLGVTEAGTGRTCVENFSITVTGGSFWNGLVWGVPVINNNATLSDVGGNISIFADDNSGFDTSTASNTAAITNTGAGVVCNALVDVVFLTAPIPFLTNVLFQFDISSDIDGILVNLNWQSGPGTLVPGVQNFPFTVSAGAIVTVAVSIGATSNGGGDTNCQVNVTLTP